MKLGVAIAGAAKTVAIHGLIVATTMVSQPNSPTIRADQPRNCRGSFPSITRWEESKPEGGQLYREPSFNGEVSLLTRVMPADFAATSSCRQAMLLQGYRKGPALAASPWLWLRATLSHTHHPPWFTSVCSVASTVLGGVDPPSNCCETP